MTQFRRKEKTNAFVFGKALQLFQQIVSSLHIAAMVARSLGGICPRGLSLETRNFIAQTGPRCQSHTRSISTSSLRKYPPAWGQHTEKMQSPQMSNTIDRFNVRQSDAVGRCDDSRIIFRKQNRSPPRVPTLHIHGHCGLLHLDNIELMDFQISLYPQPHFPSP
jgi:hypothetical protein